MTDAPLGTVVINENVTPIDRIDLAAGAVVFHCAYLGPIDFGDCTWSVFAPDGSFVFRGLATSLVGQVDVAKRDRVRWELALFFAPDGDRLGSKARAAQDARR